MRLCSWCHGPIPAGARRDAKFCGTPHRQASHRTSVRRELLEATDHPMRIAYADPPYLGLAARYYADHVDFGGEVDHRELVDRLTRYDGWALSCSSSSIPAIAWLLGLAGVKGVRLAIWHRRRPPHPTARIVTAYEGVFYRPARTVVRGSARRLTDVLLGVDARVRPTLPGPQQPIGMKPPAFLVWMFELLGAMPGDELDDLFPGSGLASRIFAQAYPSSLQTSDASRSAGADISTLSTGVIHTAPADGGRVADRVVEFVDNPVAPYENLSPQSVGDDGPPRPDGGADDSRDRERAGGTR